MKWHLAAILSATLVAPAAVLAQAPQRPAAPPAQPVPAAAPAGGPAVHVAVIDVGYIFKNHARFKAAMDKMKEQVMAAENTLKAERDRINGMMEQIKGFNPGTPEFKKLEADIAKAQGDFNVTA